MDQVQYLKAVKKEIQGGWTKGDLRKMNSKNNRGYSVCMLGACLEVNDKIANCKTRQILYAKAEFLFKKCIKRKLDIPHIVSVVTFNDNKNTKKKDVLEVIDCAISEAALEVGK